MTALILKTPPAAAAPQPMPTHDDGREFTVMATYEGGWLQAWADTDSEIVEALIGEQYTASSLTERAALRLQYLSRTQVRAMALIARDDPRFEQLDARQTSTWMGEFSGPVALAEWTASLPIPLVRQWYQPIGLVPPPTGNVLWLDAENDTTLLTALVDLGAITLARRPGQEQ